MVSSARRPDLHPGFERFMNAKKILVCPLDWGLGHAARDVGIIHRLLEAGHHVILGADGGALDLLAGEFPDLEMIRFRSRIRIRYSRRLPAWLKISFLSPLLLCEILFEHFRLARLIRQVEPDIIISDNRYGLWNRNVFSVLITHQISMRLPRLARFLEYPAYLAVKLLIGRFDRCWVPDFPGIPNLSGQLSHRWPLPVNAVFTGAISRLARGIPTPDGGSSGNHVAYPGTVAPVDLLVLLSGPEPQRSELQKIILRQVLSLRARCVILQGLPGKLQRSDITSSATMYSHLPAGELRQLTAASGKVICRAGYTSIMDLGLMKKKALIIPTPGQTEQEYLARMLSENGMFLTCSQNELELVQAMEDLEDFEPAYGFPDEDLLDRALQELS